MGLWGIDNKDKVDPIIEMLLDVFSYEIARVNDEIKISDGKLLERLARILVDERWTLPTPSHGLLKMVPIENALEVDRKTHFYHQKMEQGRSRDVFFTPIRTHKLLSAHVRSVVYGNQLIVRDDQGTVEFAAEAMKDQRVDDHVVWIGIKAGKDVFKKQKKLPICLLLKDSELDGLLKTVQIEDSEGNSLGIASAESEGQVRREHYYQMINRYYQNYLHEIDLSDAMQKRKSIVSKFSDIFEQEELEEVDEELFWLKLILPVTFTREELDKLDISLNTFPVVNRKIVYKQHSLTRNGRLVSLPTDLEGHDFFLNMEHLMDDAGTTYEAVLDSDINDLTGTYSLYFGNADRFDQRNAKGMLNHLVQTVREEGSAFSAIGYDLLNAYLEDLSGKLEVIEQKVNTSYKNIVGNLEKQYLVTEPLPGTTFYECEYWKTNASAANGIPEQTSFSQYQSVEVQSSSILLQTETVGGIIRSTTKEKINSLRSGVIARERIVSKEDIKAFVKVMIGNTLRDVEVKSGVIISPKKKEGLVRTTKVGIELAPEYMMTDENKKRMAHFIQSELEHRSVQSIPYQVVIS